MSQTSKRCLILGPAWVGDMVMAHSLVQTLENQGVTDITMMAPPWSLAVTAHMPQITRTLPMPLKHGEFALKTRLELAQSLKTHAFDQAIVLPNSFKSALIPFLARIPQRTGWLGECRYGLLNDYRILDKRRHPLMISRFAQLGLPADAPVAEAPWPALTTDPAAVAATQAEFGWQNKPTIALCPGAEYGSSKRWPLEHFVKLAKLKLAQGWQVLLFGSPKEVAMGDFINQACGNACLDFIGRTNIHQAINLLAQVDVAVCNDSGLMHIACALGRRVVAIYGSTPPGLAPALSDKAKILYQHAECSPCFKRECPLGHLACLHTITPSDVDDAVGILMASPDSFRQRTPHEESLTH